ncbi:MAG TPA: LytTR family DNA-binding domain-containing protein [Gemmatimonadales bacterium]|nr:LytTR family DNA-binding domain-containing protein [Gemmatimonadales bacterium]
MSELRVLVVDDEPIARRGLLKLLGRETDVVVLGEARNGHEAIAAIRSLAPDLVLLDVEMPELDGIGVVRELGEGPLPEIIFVTAYDRYAIAAFDLHAVDYVLKPVNPARFHTALERARTRIERETPTQLTQRIVGLLREYGGDGGSGTRLLVRAGDRSYFVAFEDIDWFEAADNYVRVHAAGQRHVIRETLRRLEEELPARFVRVHRSSIVNLDRIKEIRSLPSGDGLLVLQNGVSLTLSRGYRAEFERKVGRPR